VATQSAAEADSEPPATHVKEDPMRKLITTIAAAALALAGSGLATTHHATSDTRYISTRRSNTNS
jgi:hypothetical protein